MSLFLLTLPPIALLLVQRFQNVQPICFFAAESFSSVIHMLSIGFTQLSDVVAPNHRAAAYGLFYGSFMGGIAVAPFLSSLMSHIHVAVFSSFVRITALVIAMRYLPETLSRERRIKASEQKRDGCETANETESSVIVAFTALLLRPFREMAILGRNRTLVLLATAAFLSKMVSSADITLFFYYVENNLGVTDTDIAGMMFVAGLLGMLIQAVFLKDLISCTGERGLLLVSFCTGTVHNLMYGLAPGKSMLYCGLCLAQLSNTNNPLLSSQVSKYVAETEQGRIQGALFSLTSLAEAIGPLAFDLVSRNCRIIGPGTMFGFGAVLYGLGLVTILQLPHKSDNLNDQDNRVSEENALVTGRLVDF